MERDSIITAWESMTGKEQHDMIAACVYQVAQREHGVQALYQHRHSKRANIRFIESTS